MKCTLLTAALTVASPTFAQSLPNASSQIFASYQSAQTGLTALYPVIGFGVMDQEPSDGATVYMNDDFTIMVPFEAFDWTASGTTIDVLQTFRRDISARYAFLSENTDHNGVIFSWATGGYIGHIKVVLMQNCPLWGVLMVAYPEADTAKMVPYLEALALGFEINHSQACPALLN